MKVLLCFLILFTQSAFAQESEEFLYTNETNYPKLNSNIVDAYNYTIKNYNSDPKLLKLIAESFEMDKDSDLFKSVMKGEIGKLSTKYPSKILLHIKKDNGEKFSSMQDHYDLDEGYLAQIKEKLEGSNLNIEETKKDSAEILKDLEGIKTTLPKCKNSDTNIVSRSSETVKKNKIVVESDILFIQKEFIVDDYQEVYGLDTYVVEIEDNESLETGFWKNHFNIDCIPLRVVMTNGRLLRHRGQNALRNYDSNFHGKGLLNNIIKEAW